MEQNATRVVRQVRNPTRNQKEPANDDGTECHKSSETILEPYPEPEGTSCFFPATAFRPSWSGQYGADPGKEVVSSLGELRGEDAGGLEGGGNLWHSGLQV